MAIKTADLCRFCLHPVGEDLDPCGCPFIGHGRLKMAFKREKNTIENFGKL